MAGQREMEETFRFVWARNWEKGRKDDVVRAAGERVYNHVRAGKRDPPGWVWGSKDGI